MTNPPRTAKSILHLPDIPSPAEAVAIRYMGLTKVWAGQIQTQIQNSFKGLWAGAFNTLKNIIIKLLKGFHVPFKYYNYYYYKKKYWQCKAGREQLTPYQSEDHSANP